MHAESGLFLTRRPTPSYTPNVPSNCAGTRVVGVESSRRAWAFFLPDIIPQCPPLIAPVHRWRPDQLSQSSVKCGSRRVKSNLLMKRKRFTV